MNAAQPTQVRISAYADRSKGAILSAPTSSQLICYMLRAFNRSGGANDVGIVRRFSTSSYSLFSYDATTGDTVYTALSNAPTVSAPVTIITHAGATNNGFVVQSKYRSGLIGMTISQVDSGGGVYTFQYWNGTAWTTLTTISTPVFTSAADIVLAFLPPSDWTPTGQQAALGSSNYSIRVIAGTVPGADVKISALWAGALLEFFPSVADKSGVSLEFDVLHPLILEGGEGVMPYYGSANAGNGMTISYSTQ